jgi:thiol:disulfide interchange protein DsbC
MLYIVVPRISNAIEGCGHDCKQCHKITEKEVRKALANQGNIKITDIRMSPVKGLWQIMAERDNVKEVYYLDFEKTKMLMGPIRDLKDNADLTSAAIETATIINVSDLKSSHSLLLGKTTASIHVYVLTDPTCSACAKLHKTLTQVVKSRPEIAFQLILLPLKGMKDAYEKARYINCAKSLKALEQSYEGASLPPATCDSKEVDEKMALGAKYGLALAPVIVFPNGKVHFGTAPKAALIALINKNLK